MLNDPRLKQAFQQYEKKQEERYSEKIWKQKHLSREAEERILNALRKQSRRLMWKRILIRAGEGLAVAAVFCMMAYAVYIAAHETKEPIIAGTGETETATETATETTTETVTKTETEETKTRKIRLWMVLIMLIPMVAAIVAIGYVVTALMIYYGG